MSSVVGRMFQLAVLLAAAIGALRATCLRVWTLPSDDRLLSASVAPALEAGDVLLLWRLGTAGFGDVVRCADPEAVGRFVVARVLGVANDSLERQGHTYTVNGKRISDQGPCTPPRVSVADPQTTAPVELACELEQIDRNEYRRLRGLSRADGSAEVQRTVVPPGSVYLVSDNRVFHDDSRDFGSLPATSCNERVVLRLWSARGWFDAPRRFTAIR